MGVAGVPHADASATVNVALKLAAMVSGGSFASWSVTPAAATAIVHCSPAVRSVAGSRVNVAGPPESVPGWAPLVAQVRLIASVATFTSSVNVTVTSVSGATPAAPLAGVVDCTPGAGSALPCG